MTRVKMSFNKSKIYKSINKLINSKTLYDIGGELQ